jgi:hypothetical protein
MSGRKQKTERKKTKIVEVPVEAPPQVFFEEAVIAFLRSVGQAVGSIKNRPAGAQSLGPDGMYACAMEALDLARNSGGVPSYISAAAYAVVAAMQAGGTWGLALKPTAEQPAAPQEKSPESSKGPVS